jgi:hypothetical protein
MWFDPASPSALYEREFTAIVVDQARYVFSDFHVVKFEKLVMSDEDSAKADLALIDRKYRSWWVVEVELASHSLSSHVVPQVDTLSKARYDESDAEYLYDRLPAMDRGKLSDMLKGQQPRVIVVVNTPVPAWHAALSALGSLIVVVQIYRGEDNRLILAIDGDYPTLPRNLVTECRLDPLFPRLLKVDSPAGLGIQTGHTARLSYLGGITEWERLDSADTVWLRPLGANPLEPRRRYLIIESEGGSLSIEEKA